MSKYPRDILSPLVGNSDYNIKNSYVWVEKALEFQLREDEELVSFDVASLFTSISVELAVQIAAVRLENDQS